MSTPLSVQVNGELGGNVSPSDRGLQYGDGVFETLAVVDGVPLLWARHLARLLAGCRALGFKTLPDPELLTAEAGALSQGVERAVLKCVVTRGSGGRGYRFGAYAPTRVLSLWSWPEADEHGQAGIALHLCRTRLSRNPALAGLKHLNRLEQVLARSEWGDEYAEGVMLDTAGEVVEGTMSNLFAVHAGALRTPALTHCGVHGIMRACVTACAQALGIVARETRMELADLDSADELFVTNSIIGLWPVRRFNGREYPIGKTTQTIRAALQASGYTAVRG